MLVASNRRQPVKHAPSARSAPSGATPTPGADAVYAGAFARVRLVRAWIGAAAAMVALGYAFNALLDRLLP